MLPQVAGIVVRGPETAHRETYIVLAGHRRRPTTRPPDGPDRPAALLRAGPGPRRAGGSRLRGIGSRRAARGVLMVSPFGVEQAYPLVFGRPINWGGAMRRVRILVVDDHQMLREALVGMLEAAGFEVVGAVGDGADATS